MGGDGVVVVVRVACVGAGVRVDDPVDDPSGAAQILRYTEETKLNTNCIRLVT